MKNPAELPPAFVANENALGIRPLQANLYEQGEGEPLLLIHSINAAASAYEVKPIFEDLARSHHVFALELPGFGRAERSKEAIYDTEAYIRSIFEAISLIKRKTQRESVDVLGLSLTCEFIARAAIERPSEFRRLVFVTPTGFQRGSSALRKKHKPSAERTIFEKILRFPLWSKLLFGAFSAGPSIRFFLRRTFGGHPVDAGLIDYAYTTSHQPNAEFAPWAFVSGKLFSKDIRSVYEGLTQRVWLAHGTKGPFCAFAEAGWVNQRENWRSTAFETGAFPHFEIREQFSAALREFLSSDLGQRAKDSDAATTRASAPSAEIAPIS